MNECADVLREHALLVSRGVRMLALVGHAPTVSDVTAVTLATRLEESAVAGSIPFVCQTSDGTCDYGYAARAWVIDLYRWAIDKDAVPDVHRHRILGLLLGYDAEAVRCFEEQNSGRQFPRLATPWREQVST